MIKNFIFAIYRKLSKILAGHKIGSIYPIRVSHRFIVSHLKSGAVYIDGNKMFLDSKDSLLLSVRGIYEPFETELVKKEIKKGDVVLDLGANIGYYTLIFAKIVGKEGKVIAFEPDPTNFSLLKKNVEINGYKNVELVQKAVSNQTGMTRLHLSKENSVDHRIYDFHDDRKSIEIQAIRLDDYFKDYGGKIDFIKMDIQGAEGAAIQGMTELLKQNKVTIAMEYMPAGLRKCGTDPETFLRFLMELGYKFNEIDEKEKRTKRLTLSDLVGISASAKKIHTNLLCLKEELIGRQ